MAYLVRITPRARLDLAILFHDVHGRDSEAGLKWYIGLKEAVLTLEKLPNVARRRPKTSNSGTCSTVASHTYIASSTAFLKSRSGSMCSTSATAPGKTSPKPISAERRPR